MKSTGQRAALALHRTRDLPVRRRTELVNMIRGPLAEFGVALARGPRHVLEPAGRFSAGDAAEVPPPTQRVATALAASVSEPARFRSGRPFAASLGLPPLQNCSGGAERLGKPSRPAARCRCGSY